MSVRQRFAVTVAAVIAVTVALFATLSILAIDRALRQSFNARLLSAAGAVAATADVHGGRISLDAGDLRQLAAIHEDTPFSINAPDGTPLGGTPVPANPQAHSITAVSVPVAHDGRVFGTVTVWQSDAWIGDFERDAAIVSAVVGLFLVGIGVAVSNRVAKTALEPLDRVASLAEQIEGHDLSQRLLADGNDELGRLCASFDRMLERLEAAFERERRFVADASHELRAPLAVLRAETELALRRERTQAEYRAALESISREGGRLEELVDELLAAARAGLDATEREHLDANAFVTRLGERLRPAAALRGVDIRVETNGSAYVDVNGAMLERALLAIVHNAIAFASCAVRLDVAPDGDNVRIDVADDGAGFSTEALAHATERFWRGDKARGRDGTGLGLAIARSLLEANGGRLQLANADGSGAVVSAILERPVR
ncbi:MAG: HAMP domain-containing protein [Candidatus Eremiobacteraeota bacterium]|nr:HAMP domain-containing protein [Candidatus Eremiobacteraeota bacterium]